VLATSTQTSPIFLRDVGRLDNFKILVVHHEKSCHWWELNMDREDITPPLKPLRLNQNDTSTSHTRAHTLPKEKNIIFI